VTPDGAEIVGFDACMGRTTYDVMLGEERFVLRR
jgi:hypothetical protein